MSDWNSLKSELDLWRSEGRVATFWWRDDDVVAPTPALDRLLHLKEHFDLPLALAVIPANADAELVNHLEHCAILQHGVSHENFAAKGEKKSEFPENRPAEEVTADLTQGKETLARIFADQFVPIMVPPWNRIADNHLGVLANLGFIGVSRYKARKAALIRPKLAEINTHIDPVNWRGDRSVVPETDLLEMVTGHLAARRERQADPMEPTGLLTHHLVHDEEIWAALYKLLAVLTDHPAVRFVTIEGALALVEGLPDAAFHQEAEQALE
ncbi:polysaccharide deacetylase family protein [Sneathiella sp.]|uniref:polysaccharide deacetylase family protein n=1 Tax=Sneathiella sp. TaxID=1964365 RepID=UPI002634CAAE|nr:polysaccharide deacetylase family protein [Sneathiella sp.]MDF2367717.1 polysaccharide deacetylase family protein [Sneathiella sp.]